MNWYLGCWKKYVEFSGRARRQEFWMFVLFNFLVSVAIAALVGLVTVFVFLITLVGSIVLAQYIGVGQGFFYQDLKDGQTTGQNERNA